MKTIIHGKLLCELAIKVLLQARSMTGAVQVEGSNLGKRGIPSSAEEHLSKLGFDDRLKRTTGVKPGPRTPFGVRSSHRTEPGVARYRSLTPG